MWYIFMFPTSGQIGQDSRVALGTSEFWSLSVHEWGNIPHIHLGFIYTPQFSLL